MYKLNQRLILASGSPRRKEMLTDAGFVFDVIVSDVLEEVIPNETPEQMVKRLALLKGQAVASNNNDAWILSADTTVVVDSEILNKPIDFDDSVKMLSKLQGRAHQVWGGIAFINNSKNYQEAISICSVVYMRALSLHQIHKYIASGECSDKAGSYAIQGVGASLIEKVEGSYTNVVGLDLSKVVQKFEQLKIIE
jgi:septum formation protein